MRARPEFVQSSAPMFSRALPSASFTCPLTGLPIKISDYLTGSPITLQSTGVRPRAASPALRVGSTRRQFSVSPWCCKSARAPSQSMWSFQSAGTSPWTNTQASSSRPSGLLWRRFSDSSRALSMAERLIGEPLEIIWYRKRQLKRWIKCKFCIISAVKQNGFAALQLVVPASPWLPPLVYCELR